MLNISNVKTEDEFMSGKYTQPDFKAVYSEYLALKGSISKLPRKVRLDKFSDESEDKFSNISNLRAKTSSETGCLFRKANNASDSLIDVWLSNVILKSKLIIAGNGFPEFNGLDKSDLIDLAKLSLDENIILDIPRILLKKGIVITYVKSLEGMKLDGAVYKNEYGNPVVGLSFRFSRVDSFWFTLMHELAHIVLHYDTLDTVICDDITDADNGDLIEMQANKLARDSLISRSAWRSSLARRDNSKASVLKSAEKLRIHPAIVAGRVRFEAKDYSLCSEMVSSTDVRELVFKNG